MIDKFTGGKPANFILEQQPELIFDIPSMNRLKALCNAIESTIQNKNCSRIIANLYTNILACLIPKKPGREYFEKAGWKFGRTRYTTARKRQREDSFTDLRPSKRGRSSISDELKQKIIDEWIVNSRPAANKECVIPNNRSEKRPMLRLLLPAIQIMVNCAFVRQSSDNEEGKGEEAAGENEYVSPSTFLKYRPY